MAVLRPYAGQVDLLKYAHHLEQTRRHPALLHKMRLAISVASALQDLEAADAALRMLDDRNDGALPRGSRSDHYEATLLSALVTHAVVMYTRATETEAIDRYRWFGTGKLPKPLRVAHEDIMRTRDKVVAHFGKGVGQPDGASVYDAFVLNIEQIDGRQRVHFRYLDNRAVTKASLLAKLASLVAWAMNAARAAFNDRDHDLHAEFRNALQNDPSIADLPAAFPFEPSVFYGRMGIAVPDENTAGLHTVDAINKDGSHQ